MEIAMKYMLLIYSNAVARTGNIAAAEEAYQQAIGLEADPAVRRFLQQRRRKLRREEAD